ncbi:MAG TPA: response regulator [Gemmataceae bacterium]|jgi:two-component system sensor histidine kinase/response regulator|nr:response regulator [Gemmataceae bacterium]
MEANVCEPLARGTPERGDSMAPSPAWRILLTEDNPINQRVVVGILEQQGHSVCVTGNGKEALAAWEREHFDLALFDLEMPEMDGLEATAAIRAGERQAGRRMPILAVTSCASPEDRERCRAAGMDGHLTKPVQAATLLQAIRDRLQGTQNAFAQEAREIHEEMLINYQDLLERVDGNMRLVSEIAQMLLEDCPQWMAEIRESICQGDASRLKLAAHTFSGAVANFGAEEAHKAARALESMGRSGNLAGAHAALIDLESALDRLQPALCGLAAASAG